MRTVVNRLASNPSYFKLSDGTAVSTPTEIVVDGGVYMGGPSGDKLSGISLGGTYYDLVDTGNYPDVMFKGLPGIPYSSYGGDAIHYFNSDYADGVGPAIREGYWNPVEGAWTTSPSGDITTFAADTTNFIVFTYGAPNPDSSTI
ncbi:MAG: hypothetical protein ACK6DA_11960 [Candidatus Kapaibacterium sp.]|jgi:hypothetical protein